MNPVQDDIEYVIQSDKGLKAPKIQNTSHNPSVLDSKRGYKAYLPSDDQNKIFQFLSQKQINDHLFNNNFDQNTPFKVLKDSYVLFTKLQLSSMRMQRDLNRTFLDYDNQLKVIKFNLHDSIPTAQIREYIFRFMRRLNKKYRLSKTSYHGPTLIMILVGKGNGSIRERTKKVLEDNLFSQLECFKYITNPENNKNKYLQWNNKGMFYVEPTK